MSSSSSRAPHRRSAVGNGRAIEDAAPAIGRSGRALVASAEGLLVNEHLIRPGMSSIVRVSALPYIVPVVEHGVDRATYVVVDRRPRGRRHHAVPERRGIGRRHGGRRRVPRAQGVECGIGPAMGDPQRTAEGARRRNMRAVGTRLADLVDDGRPRGAVRRRRSPIPGRPGGRVAEARRRRGLSNSTSARVRSGIRRRRNCGTRSARRGFSAAASRTSTTATQRFSAEVGRESGLAVQGLHGCHGRTAGRRSRDPDHRRTRATRRWSPASDIATVAPNGERALEELGAPRRRGRCAPTRRCR